MNDGGSTEWLVEIFLQYQEALDRRREVSGDRLWFKEALDADRENKARLHDSASVFDSL